MDPLKEKKLREAGFEIGSASDFLGLTEDEQAFIELKLRLCESVGECRRRKKLTQIQLAKKIRSSQSRVAKIEKCDPSVSIDLIIKTLLAMGENRKSIAEMIA